MHALVLNLDLTGTFVFALAGAAVVVRADLIRAPPLVTALIGAGLCFVLRVMAIRRGWHRRKLFNNRARVRSRKPSLDAPLDQLFA